MPARGCDADEQAIARLPAAAWQAAADQDGTVQAGRHATASLT